MNLKTDLRESLNLPHSETTTVEEMFQNQTLRPVLKLQNELYLSIFMSYATLQNADFSALSIGKKSIFIEYSLHKDAVLKNIFIGMAIGMFTLEELKIYQSDSKVFNKRIITMLVERLKSQV